MAITLITGVPGTGKTAYVVSELEKVIASGRKVFVHNIPGLKLPHYRAGKITQWQKGTWFHIDVYKRSAPAVVMGAGKNLDLDYDDEAEEDEDDGNNWVPNSNVVKLNDSDELRRLAFDGAGNVVGSVPYESHKGALLVIDEAQDIFRPRPPGSAVPDHVAALEVHRKQCDIWIITQRAGLIDSNVRGLVGKHIALRDTFLGRFKYEWPEVGDIESKSSRDTAAKNKYKLPKHVFQLYKSAEVHTVHKHSLPMSAKILILALPLAAFLLFSSYKMISAKFHPEEVAQVVPSKNQTGGKIQKASMDIPAPPATPLMAGMEPYNVKEIDNRRPFENLRFSIVGRIHSQSKDIYRFSASENGQHAFYTSSSDLQKAGYVVVPLTDCSVKLIYKSLEFFVTCDSSRQGQPAQFQPQQFVNQGVNLEPYP